MTMTAEQAEEELLSEMVSYGKNVTGIVNTVFISPKGFTQHGPRIKLAIDPPESIDPRTRTVSVSIPDGEVIGPAIPPALLRDVRRFIDLNRDVLMDYWEYRIDTDQLRARLRSIG